MIDNCSHNYEKVGNIYRSSPYLSSVGRILAGKVMRCATCGDEQIVHNHVGESKWVWANWSEEIRYDG